MTLVGLGTVTTGLLAYQGTPVNPSVPKGTDAAQDAERTEARQIKTIPGEKTEAEAESSLADRERLRAEADLEKSHARRDKLLADATLIQIELEMIRKRIEKAIEYS